MFGKVVEVLIDIVCHTVTEILYLDYVEVQVSNLQLLKEFGNLLKVIQGISVGVKLILMVACLLEEDGTLEFLYFLTCLNLVG